MASRPNTPPHNPHSQSPNNPPPGQRTPPPQEPEIANLAEPAATTGSSIRPGNDGLEPHLSEGTFDILRDGLDFMTTSERTIYITNAYRIRKIINEDQFFRLLTIVNDLNRLDDSRRMPPPTLANVINQSLQDVPELRRPT